MIAHRKIREVSRQYIKQEKPIGLFTFDNSMNPSVGNNLHGLENKRLLKDVALALHSSLYLVETLIIRKMKIVLLSPSYK